MERILVGMNSETTSLWSVIYALNLAKRMKVKISVLLVTELSDDIQQQPNDQNISIRQQLEKLIHEGRADNIFIDYYIAQGSYKNELIKFIREKKITLLVVDSPASSLNHVSKKFQELLGEIKLRTRCRIEIVHRKDI